MLCEVILVTHYDGEGIESFCKKSLLENGKACIALRGTALRRLNIFVLSSFFHSVTCVRGSCAEIKVLLNLFSAYIFNSGNVSLIKVTH